MQLGVPSGGDVLYFERVEGLGALRFSIEAVRRSLEDVNRGFAMMMSGESARCVIKF